MLFVGCSEKGSHETSLLHTKKEISKKQLCQEIRRVKPEIVGFSTTTNQYPYVQLYSRWIKKEFDIPIICGGIHPTLHAEEVISDKNVDIVCRGEGENAILELVNKLERSESFTNLRSLWVKHEGKLYKNPLRPFINNLDELPFPDRELIEK